MCHGAESGFQPDYQNLYFTFILACWQSISNYKTNIYFYIPSQVTFKTYSKT